jgi:hypothetical protein
MQQSVQRPGRMLTVATDRCIRRTWKSCCPRTMAAVHGRTMSMTRLIWAMSRRYTQHNTVHLCRYCNPAQLGPPTTMLNMIARRLTRTLMGPVQLLAMTPSRARTARPTPIDLLTAQVHLSHRQSLLLSSNKVRIHSVPCSLLYPAMQAAAARRA